MAQHGDTTYALLVSEYYVMLDLQAMIQRAMPDSVMAFSADSMYEAKKRLCNNDIDFIVTDMTLSDGNVIDMLENLRWDHPVVFFSEYESMSTHTVSYSPSEFLLKPVTESQLRQALSRVRSKLRH